MASTNQKICLCRARPTAEARQGWANPPTDHHQWMKQTYLVGGFNPSEKSESQMGLLFPTIGGK